MIRYRAAEPRDVPVLRQMLQALSDHDGGTHPVGSEASLLRHGFGPRPLYRAVMAERLADGVALGMAIFYPDYSTHRGQPGVYLQDIFVSDTARGLGLGRGLMAAVWQMQDWHSEYICLGVSPDNALANGFYARLGFARRGYEMMILEGAGLQGLVRGD